MEIKEQALLLVYHKRKAGMPLTEEEQRVWEQYRDKVPYPAEEMIDQEEVERLVRWKQQMSAAEEFFQKYNIPLTIPFPAQQKRETPGRVRGFALRHLAVAASVLLVCTAAWFFPHKEANWNRLQTAGGQQRQLTLPDSTKVWLNAASVLRYPAAFGNGAREVILEEGEAYFEVTKKTIQQPFIVHSEGQQIIVLGTRFNVNAYGDSTGTVTTLLEGAVRVTNGQDSLVLKPNEASLNKQGKLSTTRPDMKQVIAWKYSFFTFHDARLSVIMEELRRWYDVKVIYVDPLQDERFTVDEFRRGDSLKFLLDNLEATNLVRFRIKGRSIYVSKQ